MKYSIIIAIYNRRNEAEELLASLEELAFPKDEFEVIFSDDGSEDGLRDYLESYQQNSDLQVVYIHQENKGPGAARNHGMEKAKGEYFIFVDSDCIVPPQWLSEVDEGIQNDELDCFGGPDAAHESFTPIQKAINYSMTSFIGTGGTRTGKANVQKKYYPRSYNMGVSRRVYEKTGGMGSLRHGQDMEYSSRIYKAGFKVGVIGNAFLFHKRRTDLRKFFKQVFNWGVTRINLGKIDQEMLKPLHYLPAMAVLGTIFGIILPFIFPVLYPVWFFLIGGVTVIALLAFVQSFMQFKSVSTSILSVVALFTQVYAYGLGFISGKIQQVRGKESVEGFTKNYYK